MKKIRKHILFSGIVQGVGFRYKTYYIAQSMKLTGWVKNRYDGRVEVEVQGLVEDIDKLVEKLYQQRFIHIDNVEAAEIPLVDECSFEVKY